MPLGIRPASDAGLNVEEFNMPFGYTGKILRVPSAGKLLELSLEWVDALLAGGSEGGRRKAEGRGEQG
jgi:hypothetical protein